MIKVFEVRTDSNQYQTLFPSDAQVSPWPRFNGKPIADWHPPRVFTSDVSLRKGDFWGFGGDGFSFAVRPEVRDIKEVRGMLETAGQLLPLPHEGEIFRVVNVTQCVDALDHDKTQWLVGQSTGHRLLITRFAFNPARLPWSTLFKIPESMSVLCYEAGSPEREFKATVERLGLTGLLFKEVWRSE